MAANPHNLIDEMIHQRTRLAIMAALSAVEQLEFNDLKAQLGLTDGNLSTHLTALEKAGYIGIEKSFRDKKPLTSVGMTAKGRKAMTNYLNILEGMLASARGEPK
jgi:DNA-binding MarR family transcriptional regulator